MQLFRCFDVVEFVTFRYSYYKLMAATLKVAIATREPIGTKNIIGSPRCYMSQVMRKPVFAIS